MLKYFNNDVIDYSWDKVSHAVMRKYPSTYQPNIMPPEKLNINYDIKTKELLIINLKTATSHLCNFTTKMLTSTYIYGLETIKINLSQKTMVVDTHNINLNSYISLSERCTYTAIDYNKTEISHELYIKSSCPVIGNKINEFLLSHYKTGIITGKFILLDLLNNKLPSKKNN